MKIAIHHRKGSFSKEWIKYCEEKKISFKVVNAYDSDIIKQVEDCTIFMWHHHHGNFKDVLTAKRILFSLQQSGKIVFPDFNTGWHFDDKVAQKYLLEAIEAPLVPSYVFYDKKSALEWMNSTTFPKVWKLKGGAGASNVKLIRDKNQGNKFINKSFSKGFSQFDRFAYFKERYSKFKQGNGNFNELLKGLYRIFVPTLFSLNQPKEKGYVYFQEFIPNNDSDIRVVIIGDKAIAEKRFVRKNDFRASGSGKFSYDGIDTDVIQLAFSISSKLGLKCIAFDFIYDSNKKPLIVEMSYGFGTKGISNAPGYWDQDLIWHTGKVNPQELIIQNII